MTTDTGRADHDAAVKFEFIAAGEPVFVLRGQDKLAAAAVRAWAGLASEAGVSKAVIEQALRQADKMDAWPRKKLPDANHLTEDEGKQLAYCFGRRAWKARSVRSVDVLLAEERGYAVGIKAPR